MRPLAVVSNVSSIAVISSSAAGGGFEVGSGDLAIGYSFSSCSQAYLYAALYAEMLAVQLSTGMVLSFHFLFMYSSAIA